jgi:hypothetical protein
MPVTVAANGLSVVHRGSEGISRATLPDACTTLDAGVVPFSNTVHSRDLRSGSVTVRLDGGHPAALSTSALSPSEGCSPTAIAGVASGVSRGAATFVSHSFDVRIEGRPVCRLTDKLVHNEGNTVNCSGYLQEPVSARAPDHQFRSRPDEDRAALVVTVVAVEEGKERPLPHARVSVRGQGRSAKRWSNKDGIARFQLPAGKYRIEVKHKGYGDERSTGHAMKPYGKRKVRLKPTDTTPEPRLPAYGIHGPGIESSGSDLDVIAAYEMRFLRINVVNDRSWTNEQQDAAIDGHVSNIQLAASKGIFVLPTLMHASSEGLIGPTKGDAAGRAHWKRFVTELCNKLKPGGSAWGGGKPPFAIRVWEIWNEPNLHNFWPQVEGSPLKPDPARFRVTLRDASSTLRDNCPEARVLFAGLSEVAKDYHPIEFLREVCDKGGKKLFDAVAFHPYDNKPALAMHWIEKLYKELKDQKLTGKDPKTDVQIWITEIGWAVPNPPWTETWLTAKNPEHQARLLKKFAKLVELRREDFRIGPTFWYNHYDFEGPEGKTWAENCGIFRTRDRSTTPPTSGPPRPAASVLMHRALKVEKRGKKKEEVLRTVPLPPLTKRK